MSSMLRSNVNIAENYKLANQEKSTSEYIIPFAIIYAHSILITVSVYTYNVEAISNGVLENKQKIYRYFGNF